MAEPSPEFQIDPSKVARYFFWNQILQVAFIGLMIMGIGVLVTPVYAVLIASWLPQRQAAALRYWLEGTTLRVDAGVFFLKRKGIPLDRVTDVVLTQGPLMRWCGIWRLDVQTAGTGQQRSEAVLYGVREPEAVRDLLLKTRDAAARADRTGYAG